MNIAFIHRKIHGNTAHCYYEHCKLFTGDGNIYKAEQTNWHKCECFYFSTVIELNKEFGLYKCNVIKWASAIDMQ